MSAAAAAAATFASATVAPDPAPAVEDDAPSAAKRARTDAGSFARMLQEQDQKRVGRLALWIADHLKKIGAAATPEIECFYLCTDLPNESDDDDADDNDTAPTNPGNEEIFGAIRHDRVREQCARLNAEVYFSDFDGDLVELESHGIVFFAVPNSLPGAQTLLVEGMRKTTDDAAPISEEQKALLDPAARHNLELVSRETVERGLGHSYPIQRALDLGEVCDVWPCFTVKDVREIVQRDARVFMQKCGSCPLRARCLTLVCRYNGLLFMIVCKD